MNRRGIYTLTLVAGFIGTFGMPYSALAEESLSEAPAYAPAKIAEGSITSVGSDSMAGLMALWKEEYAKVQPNVAIQLVSRGSATAPAALIEGTAQIGPMARSMKQPEIEEFERKYGFAPTKVRTALAATAVYVAEDNPLTKLTYKELDAVFSSERKRESKKGVTTWGELGVSGEFTGREILPLGTMENDYHYGYFRQQVLLQGEFSEKVRPVADVGALIRALRANRDVIGYGPVGIKARGVKVLAIARTGEGAFLLPTDENLVSERYPLARYLNVYLVRFPGEELDSATRDFMRFILSESGQKLAKIQGLMPLPGEVLREELLKF